jgi:hypothetical protein
MLILKRYIYGICQNGNDKTGSNLLLKYLGIGRFGKEENMKSIKVKKCKKTCKVFPVKKRGSER